jgi:hypothetical protein
MAGKKKLTINAVAARLAGGKPMAYKLRQDGAMVIVGPQGRKSFFTPDEVQAARQVTGKDRGA